MSCNRNVKATNVLFDSLMFIYILFSLFIVIFYSNASFVSEYPKLLIYIYGFLFTKLVVRFVFKNNWNLNIVIYSLIYLISFRVFYNWLISQKLYLCNLEDLWLSAPLFQLVFL